MAKKTSPPFFDALHFIHCLLDWWRGRTSLSPSYETVHHMTMVWLAPTAELQLLLFSIFTISSSAPDDPGMPKWKGKKWQHMTPRTPQWGEKLEVDGDRHCRSKKKLRIWGEFCCIISMLNANASFLFEFNWQEVCSLPVGSVFQTSASTCDGLWFGLYPFWLAGRKCRIVHFKLWLLLIWVNNLR